MNCPYVDLPLPITRSRRPIRKRYATHDLNHTPHHHRIYGSFLGPDRAVFRGAGRTSAGRGQRSGLAGGLVAPERTGRRDVLAAVLRHHAGHHRRRGGSALPRVFGGRVPQGAGVRSGAEAEAVGERPGTGWLRDPAAQHARRGSAVPRGEPAAANRAEQSDLAVEPRFWRADDRLGRQRDDRAAVGSAAARSRPGRAGTRVAAGVGSAVGRPGRGQRAVDAVHGPAQADRAQRRV